VRQACNGPRPPRSHGTVGQASNQAIKVKELGSTSPNLASVDRSREEHLARRAKRFTSHTATKQTTSTLPGQPQTSHHPHLQAVHMSEYI
jgi:hypothetical protein